MPAQGIPALREEPRQYRVRQGPDAPAAAEVKSLFYGVAGLGGQYRNTERASTPAKTTRGPRSTNTELRRSVSIRTGRYPRPRTGGTPAAPNGSRRVALLAPRLPCPTERPAAAAPLFVL
jgi:hypothetical protein